MQHYIVILGYLLLAVHISHSIPADNLRWLCTGEHSKLTFNDCQSAYYVTEGCFYKEHFSQFRPCAPLCNNVTVGSISEQRCKAHCQDYLSINCEKGFPKETTTEAMTTGSQIVDHGLYGRDKERRLATIALPAGGLAIVILLVMGIVYLRHNRKRPLLCRATQIHNPAKLIKLEAPHQVMEDGVSDDLLQDKHLIAAVQYACDQNDRNGMSQEGYRDDHEQMLIGCYTLDLS